MMNPLDAQPHPSSAATEAQALGQQLHQWITREARGTRLEVERSRSLLGDAVNQLNASFRSMEEQSRRQRATVTALVDQNGAGSTGVRQFAQSAGALISDLTKQMADDSREAVKTVQIIDEMAQHLEGIFDLLAGLKGLADQTAALASIAAERSAPSLGDPLGMVAGEARHLSARTTNFCERINGLARKATTAITEVRVRVEENAEREMNASIEARTQADGLLERVDHINRALATSIGTVSVCNERIREDVATAVRSMQFEDIVRQSLTAAHVHLERVNAINQDAARLPQLLAATGPDRNTRLQAFTRELGERRHAWEQPSHKPVSQFNMTAGASEIF